MHKKVKIFDIVLVIALSILCVVTLYPVVYVLFSSVSDPMRLKGFRGIMYKPIGFSFDAYKLVLKNPSILIGYRNTLFYVIFGTSINLICTILGAYTLSRRGFFLRKAVTLFIIFTMQFGGGLIPTYVVVTKMLGNSIWTQIIPGAISVYNLIIMRTGFSSLPESLEEAAMIDGAGQFKILMKIILPLTKPVLAVIGLYYGVGHWNQWLSASIYLRERKLFPLQLFLREILIQNQLDQTMVGTVNALAVDMSEVVKYSTIIVSIVPILCVYPFIQKYFVKGVMIGAVKG